MTNRTYTFGVKFRRGFNMGMLAKQSGMDRFVYNRLLETLKDEYHRAGRVNVTRSMGQRLVYGDTQPNQAALAPAVRLVYDAPDPDRPGQALRPVRRD